MHSVQTSGSHGIWVLVGALVLGGTTLAHAQGNSPVKPFCGNGTIESNKGEQCDSQNLGGATCQSQGFDEGQLRCNGCLYDTSQCFDTTCGDGVAQGSEACDGGDLGGKSCASQGFSGGTLACKQDCTFDTAMCTNQPPAGSPPSNGWYDKSKRYVIFGSGGVQENFCSSPDDILIDAGLGCDEDEASWPRSSYFTIDFRPPSGTSTCERFHREDPSCPADKPCSNKLGTKCDVCCDVYDGWHGSCVNAAGGPAQTDLTIRCLRP